MCLIRLCETLVYAQKIAEECNQDHIILTYDLGIAKSAMEIQITDSPEFDNIFINLGGFHIEMAFFKALGKYIDGSGLIDILSQAEILAEGSVTGFIEGNNLTVVKGYMSCYHELFKQYILKSF